MVHRIFLVIFAGMVGTLPKGKEGDPSTSEHASNTASSHAKRSHKGALSSTYPSTPLLLTPYLPIPLPIYPSIPLPTYPSTPLPTYHYAVTNPATIPILTSVLVRAPSCREGAGVGTG